MCRCRAAFLWCGSGPDVCSGYPIGIIGEASIGSGFCDELSVFVTFCVAIPPICHGGAGRERSAIASICN
ncbi:Uncharacterized protein ChrSV_1612 [Chromobacterium vaccinii]|nr:Uncharacterized protein ChrSW_1612 [Chromobacterium vaccinii]QND89070.1 Uncharacterized protein ChrSV_1612 [Chromobacterium vaccinii]